MKGLKKKIVIALLAATCVTAGAFGLSACGGSKDGNDSTLYAIYLAETNNGATQTYQQWLESKLSTPSDGQTPHIGANGNWWIGDTDTGVKAAGTDGNNGNDGRGIESVKTIDGEFVVFYTDGTYELIEEAENVPFKILKVRAKDQTNAPVKDAYFKLYYYSSKTYMNVNLGTAFTDSDGVATFIYVPEEGVDYQIMLADHGKTEYDPSCPEGYSVEYRIDPTVGWSIYYFTVEQTDGTLQELTVPFQDNSHSFANAELHNKVVEIPYSRAYSETAAGNAVETNGTADNKFTVEVKAGYHTYISFCSYVVPATSSDTEETQKLLNNATMAATGKYKFTISGGISPVLYYYVGSSGYMPADERGIPNIIISHTGDALDGDDQVATGTNSLSINNESSSVRATIFFGLYSDSDCTVTLTVERTGDAEEIPTPTIEKVPAPTNLTKFANKATGETLTLMPITGAYTAVKGTDGYYHVNSANGPKLLVMLTKAVARYLPDSSLQAYPASTDRGDTVMHFNPTDIDDYFNKDQRYPLKKYDYNAVLAEYCKYVNIDGVYGVDDNLYTILTSLAKMGVGIEYANAANGYQWLLPCYYYEPAGGLSAPGSGTEAEPYRLSSGTNNIAMSGLNGSAQIKLSVPSAGVYTFSSDGGTLSVNGDFTKTTVNGKLHVLVPEAGDVILTLTGSNTTYKVTVDEGKSIAAYFGSESADAEDATPSEGIDAETAINVIGTGAWHILDNKEVNDGVYIKFACDFGGEGNYTISLYGDGATLTYGNTTATSVTINAEFDWTTSQATEYVIYIEADRTADLMLIITKQA